jgi:hypothetical protein
MHLEAQNLENGVTQIVLPERATIQKAQVQASAKHLFKGTYKFRNVMGLGIFIS